MLVEYTGFEKPRTYFFYWAQYEQARKPRIDKIHTPPSPSYRLISAGRPLSSHGPDFVNVHHPSGSFNESSVSPVEVHDAINKGLARDAVAPQSIVTFGDGCQNNLGMWATW